MLGTGLVLAPHPASSSAPHNNPALQAAREAARIVTLMLELSCRDLAFSSLEFYRS
jgi:hypothetical protein